MKNLSSIACAMTLSLCCTAATAAKRPNIILIMADDLGWGDVGFNGNEIIKSPNLDLMASEGVKFNRFYSASAVSSPTRASVLTGRSPIRTGVFSANRGLLREEEITLPELLLEQGYTTGHFGKWHLGTLTHTQKDGRRGRDGETKYYNPPILHGYTAALVTEVSVPTYDPLVMPIDGDNGDGWDEIKEGQATKPSGSSYWDIEGSKVTENMSGDDSRIIMDRVLPFIDKSQEQKSPFLAVVWFHAPHMPVVAGEKYANMYSEYEPRFRNYAGCITAMDEQIGRLRKYLIDNDLYDNTIICFCSDNGPENAPENMGGVTGGYRGRKRSLYEGGVRVPAFIIWRDVIKRPFITDYPAYTCDYLPTLAAAAGVDNSKCRYKLDGINIKSMLAGKESERPVPIITGALRQGSYSDNQYKLYKTAKVVECYDIVADPYEKNPLPTNEMFKGYEQQIMSMLSSYRLSFEGEEYGRKSYNRVEQTWNDSMLINLKME
ncbi:MAG: sulfatase-like hydrolase/transferase [Rikenellaceae bacterium]